MANEKAAQENAGIERAVASTEPPTLARRGLTVSYRTADRELELITGVSLDARVASQSCPSKVIWPASGRSSRSSRRPSVVLPHPDSLRHSPAVRLPLPPPLPRAEAICAAQEPPLAELTELTDGHAVACHFPGSLAAS